MKNLLKSKALLFNLGMFIIMGVQHFTGYAVDPRIQLAGIAIVNIILRMFTKTGITLDWQPVHVPLAESKLLWKAKTFWVNVIGVACLAAQQVFGFAIDPGMQASILLAVNAVLRAVTKAPIDWDLTGTGAGYAS